MTRKEETMNRIADDLERGLRMIEGRPSGTTEMIHTPAASDLQMQLWIESLSLHSGRCGFTNLNQGEETC